MPSERSFLVTLPEHATNIGREGYKPYCGCAWWVGYRNRLEGFGTSIVLATAVLDCLTCVTQTADSLAVARKGHGAGPALKVPQANSLVGTTTAK
jgi:hypothetical protein